MGQQASAQRESGVAISRIGCVGELFLYNADFGYAAFQFGQAVGATAVVCIAGQADGLLSLRYLPQLSQALAPAGVRVVQPVLQSSYQGWGIGSLDRDTADIDLLLQFLEKQGVIHIVLLGHSTGCQDVVRYMATGKHLSMIKAAILQAPVSDREALQLACADAQAAADLQHFRAKAAAMISEGRGDEVLPRAVARLFGLQHAVTAYRFDSMSGRMTDDDMFSSDLTDEEFSQRLGHMAIPTLIAVSLDDEYVPSSVDVKALMERMRSAMTANILGSVDVLFIEEGGHSLRSGAGQAEFIDAVISFMQRLQERPQFRWECEVARDLKVRAQSALPGRPLMIALAGMPGAGKTTSAAALQNIIGPQCLVVPMDGFHSPLAVLKKRPDAGPAIYRRGAADTFDTSLFRNALWEIKDGQLPQVLLPSFDHALGDPVENAIIFDRQAHRIVIVEGLYLLHDSQGWEGIPGLFDHRIYLDADISSCIARVKLRNKVIPGYTPEEIDVRVEEVDRTNAQVVQRSSFRANMVVSSDSLLAE